MALSSKANGSQTATLTTEHTLATVTDAGVYVLHVDIANLTGAEIVTLRLKTRARTSDTTRIAYEVDLDASAAAGEPIAISPPIASLHELIVTLEQNGGTGRAFPWNLIQLQ